MNSLYLSSIVYYPSCKAAACTFSNDACKFTLDTDYTSVDDYMAVINACINASSWRGSQISVLDGIVTISLNDRDNSSLSVKLTVSACIDAFRIAHSDLVRYYAQ